MRGLVFICFFAFALITIPAYTQDGTILKGPKNADYGQMGRSIGPIKPSDTLWRIAQKIRPDDGSVTVYQVMSALYRKNPDAFLDKNLNHMRDGAYLRIPTIAEMRRENPAMSKQRSDQDDDLWELKKSGMLDNQTIEEAQKKVTQARKIDVDNAQQQLTSQLKNLQMEQDAKLQELQSQFKNSVRSVEEILEENNKLKGQLTNISEELQNVRKQLGQDSEIQQQLQSVIELQNALIERQRTEQQQEQSADLLSNPVMIGVLATLPALLIIGGLVMFLRKRKNANKADDEDDFLPQAPAAAGLAGAAGVAGAAAADPLDLDVPPLDSSMPVEDSVQLDDDILPEDDDMMFDSLDDDGFETGSSTLDQDELDSLLGDDVSFDDASDDNLDDFLQQNFDADDSLDDMVDLDAGSSSDDGDILSADDLDDLFNEADDSSDDELDVSDDALAALSEELATEQQEDVDIDSILDEAANNNASDDEFDLDDIDSLIDEVAEQPPKVEAADEDFDLDDIDNLLDEVSQAEEPAVEISDDDFDLDSIDSILDEVGNANESGGELTGSEDQLVDEDDIDSLLEDISSESPGLEESEDIDADDIDNLLEDSQQSLSSEAQLQEEDDFDLDDIDSLIEESNSDVIESAEQEELLEDVEQFEENDFDAAIDELIDESEENTEINDELAKESTEELASSDLEEATDNDIALDDLDDLLEDDLLAEESLEDLGDFEESELDADIAELIDEPEENAEFIEDLPTETTEELASSEPELATDNDIVLDDLDDLLEDDLLAEEPLEDLGDFEESELDADIAELIDEPEENTEINGELATESTEELASSEPEQATDNDIALDDLDDLLEDDLLAEESLEDLGDFEESELDADIAELIDEPEENAEIIEELPTESTEELTSSEPEQATDNDIALDDLDDLLEDDLLAEEPLEDLGDFEESELDADIAQLIDEPEENDEIVDELLTESTEELTSSELEQATDNDIALDDLDDLLEDDLLAEESLEDLGDFEEGELDANIAKLIDEPEFNTEVLEELITEPQESVEPADFESVENVSESINNLEAEFDHDFDDELDKEDGNLEEAQLQSSEEPKSIEQSIVDELNAMNQHTAIELDEEVPVELDNQTPQAPLKSVDEMLEELDSEEDWQADDNYDGEIDLGDDPLSDDIDLASEEELPEIDTVTPSAELESYPELDLDEELDEDLLNISETEQELSQALDSGATSEDALENDDLLTDEELSFDDVIGLDDEPEFGEISDADLTSQLSSEPAIEDLPEFDEEAALDAFDTELEIEELTDFDQEAELEKFDSDLADLVAEPEEPVQTTEAVEDELEIEDLPEFDEEAALDAFDTELEIEELSEPDEEIDLQAFDSELADLIADPAESVQELENSEELTEEQAQELAEENTEALTEEPVQTAEVAEDELADASIESTEDELEIEDLPEFDEEAALDAFDTATEEPSELDEDPVQTTEAVEDELEIEDLPEFDEEAALDALDTEFEEPIALNEEAELAAFDSDLADLVAEPEELVEELESSEEQIEELAETPDTAENAELDIEDLPEFNEEDALAAAEFEKNYQLDSEAADLSDESEEQFDLENLPEFDESAALESDEDELSAEPEVSFESLGESETLSPDAFLEQLDGLVEESEPELALAIDEAAIDEAAIEEQFMSEISDTDFDALLNDLAEPEPIDTESLDDVELNFDALLNEELSNDIANLPADIELETENTDVVEEYLDIDDLIAQSDEFETDEEPYQEANMDVGLGDFEELLAGENPPDVDLEADGYSAKLDLARAYIEIDDSESALAIIEEVIDNGPESVQAEAASLRDKLDA